MNTEFNPQAIRLIFGIGNPEERYHNTYHNIGMQCVAYCIAERALGPMQHIRGSASYVRDTHSILAQSKVSMNLSGTAVMRTCAYFSCAPHEILILHDDSDLPIGTYRIHYNRGSAGHHGIQSIIDALHTKMFFRVRIGIRPSSFPSSSTRLPAHNFVLKNITKKEKDITTEVFSQIYSRLFPTPRFQKTHSETLK